MLNRRQRRMGTELKYRIRLHLKDKFVVYAKPPHDFSIEETLNANE